VLSVEQTVKIIDRILLGYQSEDSQGWEDQITVVSRHRTATEREKATFHLDAMGLGILAEVLIEAAAAGRPYSLLVIDSLSRIKPADCDENSNDDMTAWLQALETLADTHRAWLVLIHHEGHGQRDGAISSTRGASAITAVPQVVWHLDRVKDAPTYRRLTVAGNNVTGGVFELEVANGREHKPDAIHYWRRTEVSAEYPHAGRYLVEGVIYNMTEIARLLAGSTHEHKPSTVEQSHARDVVYHWLRTCQVYEAEIRGPRNARRFRIRTDIIGLDGQPVG
jgi:hypothetical protein